MSDAYLDEVAAAYGAGSSVVSSRQGAQALAA